MQTGQYTDHENQLKEEIQGAVLQPAVENGMTPINQYDLVSCTKRFFRTAFMGLSLDIVILAIYDMAVIIGFHPGLMGLFYTLVEIPLIGGILGIFFFNEMRDLAADMIDRLS